MMSMRQTIREARRTKPRKKVGSRRGDVRVHRCQSPGCERISFKKFHLEAGAWVFWPHPARDPSRYCPHCREKFERSILPTRDGFVMETGKAAQLREVNKAALHGLAPHQMPGGEEDE